MLAPTVTILDGTTAIGSAIVQSNGSWSKQRHPEQWQQLADRQGQPIWPATPPPARLSSIR